MMTTLKLLGYRAAIWLLQPGPGGWARWVLLLAGAVLLALLLAVSQCRDSRQDARQASLERNQAQAVSDSARDAVATVGAAGGRERAIDDLTRSNADAIRNAEGADAPVDPAVRDAGLDSLCRRAAYRGDPRCVQRAAAR